MKNAAVFTLLAIFVFGLPSWGLGLLMGQDIATAVAANADAGVAPPKPAVVCASGSRDAVVLRVVDGDTLQVDIDLGFGLTFHTHGRVLGVNTPEVRGLTKAAGLKATAFTKAFLLPCNSKVTVQDRGPDKYGRRLLLVDCAGKDLAQELLKSGNAVPYNL